MKYTPSFIAGAVVCLAFSIYHQARSDSTDAMIDAAQSACLAFMAIASALAERRR